MTAQLEFFFDFMSPFAYLAHRRVTELARQYGRELRYVPMNLPAAKIAAGNTGPSNREIPVKLRYLMQDINRWAALDDMPVAFPVSLDSDRMNRGTFFALDRGDAEAYLAACFERGWGEGADISSDETLATVAASLGWSPDEFLAALETAEIEQRYAAANEEAHRRGVFGVPSFFVGEEMWWGNDRLHFIEQYLAAHQG